MLARNLLVHDKITALFQTNISIQNSVSLICNKSAMALSAPTVPTSESAESPQAAEL